MKKTLLLMGCIVIFLTMSAVVNAQILSPTAHLKGEIDSDTKAFFVGYTKVSGNFQGYQLDTLSNISLLEDIKGFPLFGSSTFEDIDDITIIDIQLTDIESLEDIIDLEENNVSQFSNVNIIAENGPFVLGTNDTNGGIEFQTELDYAISSVLTLDINQGDSTPFLILLTTSQMNMQFTGDPALLVQITNNSNIIVEDSEGNTLWEGSSTDNIFLIEDESFSFVQDSPVYMFSLLSEETHENIKMSIRPAESNFIDISSLLEDITNAAGDFGDIPDISEGIKGFESIIDAVISIVNGGMLLIETDDTFTVDGSSQTFSDFGFARGESFDVTVSSGAQTSVNGEYRLIFLGDHLYTAQAKESENGIAFPFPIVIVWAIAICLFLLFRFYLKKDINEELDKKIKRYAFIFHIVALIIAFILMDREISFQFGISAIDVILGQGISLFLLVFVIVELIMWALGYLILAIPVRIITNSGLRWFGIGKDGKNMGKGVGALFIWIFCALYVKLIVNLIFLIMNPSNFFQMG